MDTFSKVNRTLKTATILKNASALLVLWTLRFLALIVCMITLIAIFLLGSCHTGGFCSRSFAWLCGRPPKSDQRLALEAQWRLERAAILGSW